MSRSATKQRESDRKLIANLRSAMAQHELTHAEVVRVLSEDVRRLKHRCINQSNKAGVIAKMLLETQAALREEAEL